MHKIRFDVIIVVVQVGAVKIYAAQHNSGDAQGKRKKRVSKEDETQFFTTQKNWLHSEFDHPFEG
jgi:hypothetical protein